MTTASSRGRALRGKGLGRRMTGSIGSFVVRRARLVLVAALLAVVGFGVLGFGAFGNDILTQVGKSLRGAEGIAVPIILALLVFAFGSVVAALLPLAIGVIAILGTFAELDVLGSVTNVAIYAINLATALGLALAIDYG